MRDVDNNLSAVTIELTSSSSSCANSNDNTNTNQLECTAVNNNYAQLRDKLWGIIDKEICMSQCDIYRY